MELIAELADCGRGDAPPHSARRREYGEYYRRTE